jgi:NAD(P)-dependent dehydrogenase (short-subunit alcohol dehydrogenase family)
MLDFSGRVAVVTGAGRGLGRETALSLARRGASVLVNDYGGGSSTTRPGSIEVAQAVVDEITAMGGHAAADASSVGSAQSAVAIVDHALAEFGRIDILVNNAGGNVRGAIDAHDDELIESVLRGNFIGAYLLVRTVWRHMRAAGYGRIVNILSSAMLGLEGACAYAPAKAALMGVTNQAAIEGAPLGIGVNGVLPVATTRLSDSIPPGPLAQWMRHFPPALVAEGIAYLCSAQCEASGEMFSMGGGRVAATAIVNAVGFFDADLTAESLAANFAQARDLSAARVVASAPDETAGYYSVIPWPEPDNPPAATPKC